MARLVEVAGAEGPANDFERIAVRHFVDQLPADYFVIPNFVLAERDGQRFEYDVACRSTDETKDFGGFHHLQQV